MSNLLLSAIYGIAAAAIWGGMYVVSDLVLVVIPPFTLLSIRLIMGVVVLYILARLTHVSLRGTHSQIARWIGVGVVGFGLSVGAQFVGTDLSTAVNGSLITSAAPAFIVVFAALLLRERLTLQRIASVVLATIGVIVIVDLSRADFSSATFVGNLILASAALTWGLYSVLVRQVSTAREGQAPPSTTAIAFYAMIGGLVITLPASALELPTRPIGTITPAIMLGIFYLGVISMAGATWLWNRAFTLVEASVASLYFFAQPLVGALLGVIVLGQAMTPALWLGSALIVGGVLLATIQLSPRIQTVPRES